MTIVDEIPVANTPPGGYGTTMPAPILAGCTEPLVHGAPDLRGTWRVISVATEGVPQPHHTALGNVQRVEQAGDRIVITSAGVVHDMRCDGTFDHGVHDVMQSDFTTAIGPPSCVNAAAASSGVRATIPFGTLTPALANNCLPWYS